MGRVGRYHSMQCERQAFLSRYHNSQEAPLSPTNHAKLEKAFAAYSSLSSNTEEGSYQLGHPCDRFHDRALLLTVPRTGSRHNSFV